jgi:beta-N-acetylhexosaminidase
MKWKIISLCYFILMACQIVGQTDNELRKKLGQLFIVGFMGPIVTDSIYADLSERNLGGVILSYINGNLESPTQIQQLTNEINVAAQTPPFICADQEGGLVARLSGNNGFSTTYSAYKLGMVFQSLDSTRVQAQLMASWMKCGFNLNLAPVVDVAKSPYDSTMYFQRIFSTDPLIVAEHAQTFSDQFRDANIATTLKHFPGIIGYTSISLIPYTLLLDSNRVDMIMVAHHRDSNIDPINFTSLSAKAVQGLLRDSLGYQGVVITDDLYQMSPTHYYGYGEAAKLALNAGDDILLYVGSTTNGGSLVRQIIDTLELNVLNGKIPLSRIDEAYNRILALKNLYNITSTGAIAEKNNLPNGYHLSNFPNPFNPSTTIRFSLPRQSFVLLKIFDLLGREVATLVNEEKNIGSYNVEFTASDLPSGVYFYRLQAGSFAKIKKMILLK